MIQATFYKNDSDMITGFSITGHADSGPYGYDIVCAAVSAVSIGTTNNLERLAGIEAKIDADNENGGKLIVSLNHLNVTDIYHNDTQLLMNNLYLTLKDISDEYKDYITLKIEK